jgi:hypothetical protein
VTYAVGCTAFLAAEVWCLVLPIGSWLLEFKEQCLYSNLTNWEGKLFLIEVQSHQLCKKAFGFS